MLTYFLIVKISLALVSKKVCYPYNKYYGMSNILPDYFFYLMNDFFCICYY
jgi:hypothetical protein